MAPFIGMEHRVKKISILTTCVLITSRDLYTIKPEVIIIIYNIYIAHYLIKITLSN
jgi:hypothetical protein